MNRYAIIDGAQCVGFNGKIEALNTQFNSLFRNQAEQNLVEVAPLVVELHGGRRWEENRIWREIEKLAKRRPAVSVVTSKASLEALASHLGRFHITKVPDRRQMILRWYDTRILPVWMGVMSPSQHASFCEGIETWVMYDRFGNDVPLPVASEWTGFPAIPPLELDETQYSRMLEASEPDVLIAHLRQVIRDELKRVPETQLYPFVVKHLNAARAHGLEDFDDRVQYLLLALYTSGQFVDHPAVKPRLRRPASEHESPFSAWAMGLPEDVAGTSTPLWRF